MSKKRSLFTVAMVILVIALMVSFVSIKPAQAANLVGNPGFETGSLSPWTSWGTVSVQTSNVHGGTKSAKVGTASGATEQVVSGLTPNTSYTLTGWVKTSATSVTSEVGVKEFGGTETYSLSTSTSYTQLTVNFTTGASNTSAKIFCYKVTASGYLYCDDFSLTSNAAPTPTKTNTPVGPTATKTNTPVPATPTNTPVPGNLVGNPGYETGSLSPWTNTGTVSIQTTNVHRGTYSAKVGTGSGATEQVLSGLKSNTTYLLTGWVKTSTSAVTGVIGVKEFDGLGTQNSVNSTSTTYTQLSVTFAPAAGYTSARIFCYLYTGSGYIYCDDFSVTQTGPTPTPAPTPVRTLVWSDEFNTASGTQPNPADWGYEIGYIRNNELQYYTNSANNAYMDGSGNLVIKAIKDSISYPGYAYTSASINTYGKHSWQYGRIEMRAKLPYGKGIWPAFWGMGDSGSWPACGEIDTMEMIGGGAGYDNKAYGTAHWDDGGHQSSGGSYTLPSGNFSDAYHIFAIEWNATTITWYVDSTAYFSTNISSAAQSELRQPFDIMLNLAVGGSWPGNPDGSTVFPQYYYIDYVRIYQ